MKCKISRLIVASAVAAGVAGLALLRRQRRMQVEALAWQKRRRPALDVLACPRCHGALTSIMLAGGDGYHCAACQKGYPVVNGIPHFIEPGEITGWNKRLAGMYDWFSWGYRLFSRAAFTIIGMTEEQGRREITDRLEPKGGRVLEVSIGPGVNLPYLVRRQDMGEIYGLDISLGQLNRCREYVAHRGWDIQLQLGNAEQLPYQDNTFDGVFHVGGINFFNDKGKAIAEMIRVAKPGSRILISDEKEKGAQAYERLIPGFTKNVGKEREVVVAPLALIPPEMENLRLFDVWGGWFYCIEFTKPGGV
jgi:ubiquinone/menaquinone biosynthesis C-methylase UbiE/uncharacterized protein YbaR (Trm112 family)